jgi:hypothetical protein
MGESPLSMMRQPAERLRLSRPSAAPKRRRRRRWPIATAVAIVLALACAWVGLWYYTAALADRTVAGWTAREAAAGRIYSCATQTIGGFPFSFEARCADAVAEVKGQQQPPFTVRAKDVVVSTQVLRPTLMNADLTGPLTYADTDQPPSLIADWSHARVSVLGPPPDPQSVAFTLDRVHVDRAGAGSDATRLFKADHVDIEGRIIDGTARDHPVVEATLHVKAAAAPALHPATREPTDADIDVVVRGFKDLSTQPWPVHFRELQAAGGSIEIKYLRFAQADARIVGTGTLTLNAQGRLEGLVRVALVNVDQIVPLLGIDQLIGHGVDRLAGAAGTPSQGLGTLDRLVPGLSGAVRASANATVIDNLKKMGEPTEIDHQPAILLPLRISDGALYLGMVPLGQVPALF